MMAGKVSTTLSLHCAFRVLFTLAKCNFFGVLMNVFVRLVDAVSKWP